MLIILHKLQKARYLGLSAVDNSGLTKFASQQAL